MRVIVNSTLINHRTTTREDMKKLSKPAALKIIRGICRGNGTVIPTNHVRERMAQRQFDFQDVLHVLESGVIQKEPDLDVKTGKWSYRIEGMALDGESLHVCVAIYEEENIIVVLTGIQPRGR